MPNGISCAYFGVKNMITGQKEKNPIKGRIADIQGIRTADEIASGLVNSGEIAAESVVRAMGPISKGLGTVASILKKALYPLIIASGIYDTSKSKDKVKTGASAAGGIMTMYTFEKCAEHALSKFKNYTDNCPKIAVNKKAKTGLYVVRGLAYAAASVAGYSIGKNSAASVVEDIRKMKNQFKTRFGKENAASQQAPVFKEFKDNKVSVTA